MRKADYAALADQIKKQRTARLKYHDDAECEFAAEELEQLARNFAARASVDKAGFLKACGIEE